jgi:hypothetical protein
MQFSPCIQPQLRAIVRQLDDGTVPIAAVWREASMRARSRKLLQPSYESVRRLVHEQRRRTRPVSTGYSRVKRWAILAYELVFRTRDSRLVVLDAITGDDIDRRLHVYQRRPRDKSSQAIRALTSGGPRAVSNGTPLP